MHRCCQFGENVSNNVQDIMLIMFWEAHTDPRTDGRTDEQDKNELSGHTLLSYKYSFTLISKC